MSTISRRKLAAHAADRIARGDKRAAVMRELAAYLIDSGRQREAELLTRDIETALLHRGTAIITTTSARPLTSDAKSSVAAYVKAVYKGITTVAQREVIDEQVIGGVKIELPDAQLDGTVRTKLEKLTVN